MPALLDLLIVLASSDYQLRSFSRMPRLSWFGDIASMSRTF